MSFAYLGVFALHPVGDGWSAVLHDAYLFQQYAAAWTRGEPYAFMPGDAPSTGSSSHLYPLLLALPHALGARGGWLAVVSAWAGALSLFACVALSWSIARRVAPDATGLAVFLAAASGHLALALFGQSEAALVVPLVLGCFASLLAARAGWLTGCLVLLSLARPEGAVLALALGLASFGRAESPLPRAALRGAAALGLAAAAATAALNWGLTASVVPDSIEAKGLFRDHPPAAALGLAAAALGDRIAGFFLGLGAGLQRMYQLPVLAGGLALAGFAAAALRGRLFERFAGLAVLGALAVDALSGGGGEVWDRYLAWVTALLLVYAAAGARAVARWTQPGLFAVLAVALGGYQLLGAAHLWSVFGATHARTAANVRFVEEIAGTLPEGARVGVARGAGLAWLLPGHPVTNVNGVVSPAFAHPHPNLVGAEILAADPALRFDYWLLPQGELRTAWYRPFVGRPLRAEGPEWNTADRLGLFEADWSALEARPPETAFARVEVGWPESEARHAYRLRGRGFGLWIEPALVTGPLAGRAIADVGRYVRGGESFRLPAPPARRVRLELRTAWRARAVVRSGGEARRTTFSLPPPLELRVRIDGESVAAPRLEPSAGADAIELLDIPLELPASVGEWIEVEVDGEYLSLGWRLYADD